MRTYNGYNFIRRKEIIATPHVYIRTRWGTGWLTVTVVRAPSWKLALRNARRWVDRKRAYGLPF